MSEARWWAAHAEASRALASVPGVVGVGLGVKETAGELTGEVSVIVYVERKRVASALKPGEVLPQSIAGVKTDVQEMMQFAPFGGTTLNGGSQIRRTPDGKGSPKPGTLGYVATRIADNMNVMLSCDHVMLSRRRDDLRIFHPDVSRCCGSLKNAVGGVLSGKSGKVSFTNSEGPNDYFIDAAIASIITGVTGEKSIPGLGKIIGSGDLTASPVRQGSGLTISAGKRGIETAITHGDIDDVAFPFKQLPQAPTLPRMIRIRPKPSEGFPFTKTFKVPSEDITDHLTNFPLKAPGGTATQVSTDEIRFDVPVFVAPGDSGAALVDTGGNTIIGLIVSGSVYVLEAFKDGILRSAIVPTGFGVACHIQPILEQLGIRIDPSTDTSSGRPRLVPGDEITAAVPDKFAALNARLADLEQRLDGTPKGRRMTKLLRRHGDELIELVHHRRRVLAEWHRHRGPAFAALLIEALLDENQMLPSAVDGVSHELLLTRMKSVLDAEGSSALKASMAANEELMFDLLARSRTVNELVANLT